MSGSLRLWILSHPLAGLGTSREEQSRGLWLEWQVGLAPLVWTGVGLVTINPGHSRIMSCCLHGPGGGGGVRTRQDEGGPALD